MTNRDLTPESDHSYDSDWEPAVDLSPSEDEMPLVGITVGEAAGMAEHIPQAPELDDEEY